MDDQRVRSRIAPTPSGYLHLGNVFSFVLTWLLAKQHGGSVRLRIDDLDAERVRIEYLEDIFRTLEFIGLQPDEGPSGVQDHLEDHSQLLRMHVYEEKLEQLKDRGLLYACDCSRKKIREDAGDGHCPGNCRDRGLSFDLENTAWRIRVPEGVIIHITDALKKDRVAADLFGQMGDFIVRRRDGRPAYQVASLCDDLLYNINMVVRGEDLLGSTAAQIFLGGALHAGAFEHIQWVHHPLIGDEKNAKLSKSAGHTSIKWMISQGLNPSGLFDRLVPFLNIRPGTYQNILELKDGWSAQNYLRRKEGEHWSA
ncbi:MAG TPA: glutamate--tRNA ligase family protein [Phnomibacter sp.]|nr:glutamate--tRNA ligase family protein [Phnomibacter sp.]